MAAKGILYMIPCPISDATEVGDVTPAANGRIIDTLDYFIVENVRSARRFLARAKIARRIDDLEFVELNEHTRKEQVAAMIDPIERGRSAGVISEAGMPGVADPGALAAAECHRRGIRVVPLVGPSSILLALAASGLNGQLFAFAGYLPVKPPERAKALKALERRARTAGESQIFIEAPYRNVKLLEQMLSLCDGSMCITVACDITSPAEFIVTDSVSGWSRRPMPDIAKRPTIFIIGRSLDV